MIGCRPVVKSQHQQRSAPCLPQRGRLLITRPRVQLSITLLLNDLRIVHRNQSGHATSSEGTWANRWLVKCTHRGRARAPQPHGAPAGARSIAGHAPARPAAWAHACRADGADAAAALVDW